MKIYLVGGAVRDFLLNIPNSDKDFVVVGATPDDMLKRGFKRVGRDFPVFLHPKTGDEYALARTETQTGRGHTEFSCQFDPNVSLHDDLKRRDFTINAMAMAMDDDESIIDPHGGQRDIERKILRHVGPAFAEDPLRILRLCRFSARLATGGFQISHETKTLCKNMIKNGDLDFLSRDRIWLETQKVFLEPGPWIYFETLAELGAFSCVVPYDADCPDLTDLQNICHVTTDAAMRFAAFMMCFSNDGKDLENANHEGANTKSADTHSSSHALNMLNAIQNMYPVPNLWFDTAFLCVQYVHVLKNPPASPEAVLEALLKWDALRKMDRFMDVLQTFSPQNAPFWRACLDALKSMDVKGILKAENPSPNEIPHIIQNHRIGALQDAILRSRPQ